MATVLSATEAANPARVLGVSIADSVDCSESSELVNVPNAETWASSELSWVLIWFCWAAP